MVYYNKTKKSNLPRINRQIIASSVRLIDETGAMLENTPLSIALDRAEGLGLDLVEISPKAVPPVCKIMDFGKYKYETKRNLQKAKKKQKVVETKEIRLRPTIGDHDLDIKINRIKTFIAKGNKVRVSLRFKGRQTSHHEVGANIIEKVLIKTAEVSVPEIPPKREGMQIVVTLVAKVHA